MPILVLTADPLPLPKLPATGAGLRAWGLAGGLASAGLPARALMPRSLLEGRADASAPPYAAHVYPDGALEEFLRRERPEAIVLQHWGMMARVGQVDCPIAIDLAGPHLLERRHWGQANLAADGQEKLAALRRADFVVCSGRDQRLYFLPYLMLSGFDAADPALCPAIPFCWSPEGPPPRPHAPGQGGDLAFVAGGVLLPWQNPLPSIRILLEEMDRAGRGRLIYCGGAHPGMNVAGGEVLALLEALQSHPRCTLQPLMPLDQWLQQIARADVAFDLLPRNNERELAFPTRTAMYLWSGLPTLHADYDELARWIGQAQAGWAVDPANEDALRQTLRRILADGEPLEAMAQQARRLGETRLNWTKTIEPLADFCRHPVRRQVESAAFGASASTVQSADDSPRIQSLQHDLALARGDLAALHGKWPFRLARKAKKIAWLTAPVVYPVSFVVLFAIMLLAKLADRGRARTDTD